MEILCAPLGMAAYQRQRIDKSKVGWICFDTDVSVHFFKGNLNRQRQINPWALFSGAASETESRARGMHRCVRKDRPQEKDANQ
jgi:hypothetical protein